MPPAWNESIIATLVWVILHVAIGTILWLLLADKDINTFEDEDIE